MAVDLGFVARVFAALLLVVFLPVPSQFDAVLDIPIAGVLSQLNLGLPGLVTWGLFRYASACPGLRDPRLTDRHATRMLHRDYLVLPAISAVALALSAAGMTLAGAVYRAAPVALWWMVGRDGLDRQRPDTESVTASAGRTRSSGRMRPAKHRRGRGCRSGP